MAHAENEVVINRPISEVYNFIANGINNTKWRDSVVSISLAQGQAGALGAEYKQVLKGPGGRTIPGDYRITTANKNKELSFLVTAGPARPTGNFKFSTVTNGTKVKFTLDFQPRGIAKLMGPMINKTMQHEVSLLAQLKVILEKNK